MAWHSPTSDDEAVPTSIMFVAYFSAREAEKDQEKARGDVCDHGGRARPVEHEGRFRYPETEQNIDEAHWARHRGHGHDRDGYDEAADDVVTECKRRLATWTVKVATAVISRSTLR